MENLQHEIMANFRRRNQTVKDWAAGRGLAVRMVGAVIRGERSGQGSRGPKAVTTQKIRAALIEDGFWPVEEDDTAEHTGPHRH